MDFQTAIKTCFNKYATFAGRAARSEYWYFYLFIILSSIVLTMIESAVGVEDMLTGLFSLGVFLPTLAAGVRRLHDIDRSGWWILIGLIPLIGFLVLLFWFVQKGTEGNNQYGEDPLTPSYLKAKP